MHYFRQEQLQLTFNPERIDKYRIIYFNKYSCHLSTEELSKFVKYPFSSGS